MNFTRDLNDVSCIPLLNLLLYPNPDQSSKSLFSSLSTQDIEALNSQSDKADFFFFLIIESKNGGNKFESRDYEFNGEAKRLGSRYERHHRPPLPIQRPWSLRQSR